MTNFIQKSTAMIAVFMLFCAKVVAQNEKITKSLNNDSYGVVVPGEVLMHSGEIRYLTITPLSGYDNPVLIYQNSSSIIDSVIEAEIFTARILAAGQGGYILEITAHDVDEVKYDALYVKAIQIYTEFGLNNITSEGDPGACVAITVYPNKK